MKAACTSSVCHDTHVYYIAAVCSLSTELTFSGASGSWAATAGEQNQNSVRLEIGFAGKYTDYFFVWFCQRIVTSKPDPRFLAMSETSLRAPGQPWPPLAVTLIEVAGGVITLVTLVNLLQTWWRIRQRDGGRGSFTFQPAWDQVMSIANILSWFHDCQNVGKTNKLEHKNNTPSIKTLLIVIDLIHKLPKAFLLKFQFASDRLIFSHRRWILQFSN